MRERIVCEEVEIGTAEYLDGVLRGSLHERFGAHLESCAECSDHLQRIRWTIDHLRALPQVGMPPGMKARLLAALQTSAPSADPPYRRPSIPRSPGTFATVSNQSSSPFNSQRLAT